MKKVIYSLATIAIVTLMAACDGKTCICYQQVNGKMTETETYADLETACRTLSTSTRTCVEVSEEIDPNAIATPYKHQSVDNYLK